MEREVSIRPSHPSRKLTKRGWELLCSHREPVLAEVVKDFYANMVQPRGKSVFVRGKWVSFDKEDIKKVFNLKLAKDGHRFK